MIRFKGDRIAPAMRTLIAAAGLSEQHQCHACGRLLMAWGRPSQELWACPEHPAPEATTANLYEPGAAS